MYRDMKPTFGQTGGTSAFGGGGFGTNTTASPFAQSTFGKPTTTGFTSSGFGSTGTSLFGTSTSGTSGGLFGSSSATPVFGQMQTTQPSGFGFGSANTGNSLFGNQNTGSGLFATNVTTSAFGQNKPTFGGFGSSGTGLFGQQQQQPTQGTSLFGQPATSTGIFGSSGFGSTNQSAATVGTVIKFTPLTGTDTMSKNGVTQTINTRHHCITCMKEYENKSLEELRLEDYMANRKGQQAGQQAGLFGTSTQPSLFGANTSTGGTGLFTENKPLFSGFGTNTGGVFGSANQQSTSLFTKPTGFGTTTTTSGTGFTNPFGASTQAKSFATVTPQTNTLFGSTSQPSSGFGTQSSGFGGFGAQPSQGLSLFGQNKTPFSMTTTTSGGFGLGQNTATSSGSLFGQKPAGTTGFGGFGNTTTSTFGSTNLFGTNQNAFNKPFQTTSTGFTIGQTSATNTGLGTGFNLGNQSIFGQQNKPNSLYGNTSTGLFGGFGNTSSLGTGTGLCTMMNPGGNSLLGGTGIGAQPNPQSNVSVHQQILSLASMPFGDSPLFRNLLPATGKADEVLRKNTNTTGQVSPSQYKVSTNSNSKLKVKPVTPSVLSKKALFDGLDDSEVMNTNSSSPNVKRLVLKTKVIPDMDITNRQPSTERQERQDQIINLQNEANKENSRLSFIEESKTWIETSLDKSLNEKNIQQRSPDKQKNSQKEKVNTSIEDHPMPRSGRFALNDTIKENSSVGSSSSSDDSQEALESNVQNSCAAQSNIVTLTRVGYYTIPSLDELSAAVEDNGRCIVDTFTVGREGYGNVFFPDSFDVAGLNLDEIVHFRHKEVVIYPDDEKKPPIGEGLNRKAQVTLDRVWPIDKTTHEPIMDPDRLSEMDYEGKLQRVCAKLQARFLEYRPQTGSWVFKVDHFSKYGLSDSDEDEPPPSAPKKAKLPLASKVVLPKSSTQEKKVLLGLASTGRLVELPVRQGLASVLLEDDQEMGDGDAREHYMLQNGICEAIDIDEIQQSPTEKLAHETGTSSHKVQLMKASLFVDDEISQRDSEFADYDKLQNEEVLHLSTRFTDDDLLKITPKFKLSKSFSMLKTHFGGEMLPPQSPVMQKEPAAVRTQSKSDLPVCSTLKVPMPVVPPKTVMLKYRSLTLPLCESSAGKLKGKCLADVGLFKGRSFHVGWGKDNTFLTLSTRKTGDTMKLDADLVQLENYIIGRRKDDFSDSIVQRLKIDGGCTNYSPNFCESIENHLQVQLDNSLQIADQDCPKFFPKEGVDALHTHFEISQELCHGDVDDLTVYCSQVWQLCVALWGNLPQLDPESKVNSHHTVIARREAVSEWIETVVASAVRKETADILGYSSNLTGDEHHVKAVFSCLTGRDIKTACEHSSAFKDSCTALLLGQIGGSQPVRQLMHKQLSWWKNVEADLFIDQERLKLFMLVAGIPLFNSSHGTINVCENLDWKRAFAVHLWYICSPVASVTDGLLLYEKAFKSDDVYAQSPDPPYITNGFESELSSGRRVYDLCYHLLKLYSVRSYALEPLLNPATHTSDPLDYRLSWLLLQVLAALGYTHVSNYSAAHIHVSFSNQLQSHGMWHWAIFVLMHLEDYFCRKSAILDVLGRHIQLNEEESYLAKETFLLEKLKLPEEWIYEAKATAAIAENGYVEAAWYLMKAGQWNAGHKIIMQHLAADSIINENFEFLQKMLEPFVAINPTITVDDWNIGGQILWDYLQVRKEVEEMIKNPATVDGYQLEKLQPRLASLCSQIKLLPCPTNKDRLCQFEIAKRTAHLVRNILILQKSESAISSHLLVSIVTKLPLPESYILEELDEVLRNWKQEVSVA